MKKTFLRGILFAAIAILVVIVFLVVRSVSEKNQSISVHSTPIENDMVVVPAGFFWMGSQNGEKDELPVHKVWLDSFYIDRFPVTNAQYEKFVKESGYEKPLYWNDPRCHHPDQYRKTDKR